MKNRIILLGSLLLLLAGCSWMTASEEYDDETKTKAKKAVESFLRNITSTSILLNSLMSIKVKWVD
ncbi:hypothetical protein [Bacillus sp. N1-1]|jgi:PBP1b-binding outer membrane lipoprotein LpoB|uniref:hypothetical protein n=1 Tax=Bacillus sp. N1-1 TaxID=2682541 RepID=UPI0013167D52|nr:hypothetical protein [Bacillus sp. N1-1]QHA91102.1 hypothetical protein GNK04_06540 [Bacillus sp. N1-1]